MKISYVVNERCFDFALCLKNSGLLKKKSKIILTVKCLNDSGHFYCNFMIQCLNYFYKLKKKLLAENKQ